MCCIRGVSERLISFKQICVTSTEDKSTKPDARPKHQKPYRLSPDKKKVLEHQLEHLLEQGIIAPLSAHEDIPITSPVVLVEKRTKSETKCTSEKERSLRSYKFCVDLDSLIHRLKNSATQSPIFRT
ncbi:polyprotein of retroviral origin [Plakobranchus ocellatus]|uniref:Polyprotein of retroviral origin n=1 Tax=Plakobranchus ocellatus TaxID=259542 RepID=A0AAV4CK48_9GAST|nr:polyprotein of retroviral origin [Plakobranchus ocellatus]